MALANRVRISSPNGDLTFAVRDGREVEVLAPQRLSAAVVITYDNPGIGARGEYKFRTFSEFFEALDRGRAHANDV